MLSGMMAYRRWWANGDRQSSCLEKGVIMGLIVTVIGEGDNVAETEVFCCVFWNV